ncbi:UNVERIFIED_CONTAM: hypothetical protein FKN15_007202 [Acipenser sinensis]
MCLIVKRDDLRSTSCQAPSEPGTQPVYKSLDKGQLFKHCCAQHNGLTPKLDYQGTTGPNRERPLLKQTQYYLFFVILISNFAVLYEVLYKDVFGIEEEEVHSALDVFHGSGGRRYRNSSSMCSEDANFKTSDEKNHKSPTANKKSAFELISNI